MLFRSGLDVAPGAWTPTFTPTVAGLVYMDAGNTAVVKILCGGYNEKGTYLEASPSLHQFSGFLVA